MNRPGRLRKHDAIADEIRQAIAYGTTSNAVRLLKDTDNDVLDGESRTPIIHASIAGNAELVTWLIENGADINHQDRDGWSAIHFAVQERNIEALNSLLANGAAVDLMDAYGNTPLWRATFDARGDYRLVQILIAHGADAHSKNHSNRSPLDFAEQVGDQQLVATLMDG